MTRAVPPQDAERLFEYPKSFPFFRVYLDTSRRVSTCQACALPIKKKTQRLIFMMTTYGRPFKNGGQSSYQTFFLHIPCAKRLFVDCVPPEDAAKRCWDCREPITIEGGCNLVCVSRAMRSPLCGACSSTPRYRKCDACGVLFPKYLTSRLADTPEWWRNAVSEVSFVCEFCAETDGLVTVKMIKRLERKERSFQDKYETIIERIHKGSMFE